MCKILDGLDVNYWIDSGTLLEAYRSGKINKLDHDIDVRSFSHQWDKDKTAKFIGELWKIGYEIITVEKPIKSQILTRSREDVLLDFKFVEVWGEWAYYYCWAEPNPTPRVHLYPKRFFDNLGQIQIEQVLLPCPSPVDEYIRYHYGDEWMKFKVRKDDANKTDMTWDHLYDPPCSKSLGELYELMGEPVDLLKEVQEDR